MHRLPSRQHYKIWLEIQGPGRGLATNDGPPCFPLPDALPRPGYLLWFFHRNEYLGTRFDPYEKCIAPNYVRSPTMALHFETFQKAYARAETMDAPCLILRARGRGEKVEIAG